MNREPGTSKATTSSCHTQEAEKKPVHHPFNYKITQRQHQHAMKCFILEEGLYVCTLLKCSQFEVHKLGQNFSASKI